MTGEQLDLLGDGLGAFGLPGVEWTATELRIGVELSFEDWERLVVGLFRGERAIQFAIGDALVYGEALFGEPFAQIEATLERQGLRRAPESLRKYMWVAERVAPSRRRDDVSFTAHLLVARLSPEQQTEFLERTASKGLSTRELREQVVAASELLPVASPVADPSARALQLERVVDVATLIVNSCTPERDGRVCVDAPLFERLAAAVHGEAEA